MIFRGPPCVRLPLDQFSYPHLGVCCGVGGGNFDDLLRDISYLRGADLAVCKSGSEWGGEERRGGEGLKALICRFGS